MKPSAEKRKATLVVGTTPDYIEWLRAIAPGRCLFLTDPLLRQGAKEPRPKANEEILCDLADYPLATARLVEHLTSRGIEVDGIVCFDDESMDLAALLAGHLSLPYPSRESIALCRDKYLSKVRWREAGVPCPRARMVHDGGEAERFFAEVGGRMVLKPPDRERERACGIVPDARGMPEPLRGDSLGPGEPGGQPSVPVPQPRPMPGSWPRNSSTARSTAAISSSTGTGQRRSA